MGLRDRQLPPKKFVSDEQHRPDHRRFLPDNLDWQRAYFQDAHYDILHDPDWLHMSCR